MTRAEFHAIFGCSGPVVLPVIHVLDTKRTLNNIRILESAGAAGCFLINHDFDVDTFLPIIREVRTHCPDLWLGVNFLAVTGRDAFPVLGSLEADGVRIDAYWADDARIDEHGPPQREAEAIADVRALSGWNGLYFGGTAFKKQRPVAPEHHQLAAAQAIHHMDVVTTSGTATGREADQSKMSAFRVGAGDRPLALASGVTPENARHYANVDCFMVATGINAPGNFYDIAPERLAALLSVCRALSEERIQ